jgi:hypothetical protein
LIFSGVESKRVENDHSTGASSRALGLENEGYALTLIFLKLNDETLPEEVEGKGGMLRGNSLVWGQTTGAKQDAPKILERKLSSFKSSLWGPFPQSCFAPVVSP